MSVAEQAGLSWSKIPKDTFSSDVAQLKDRTKMKAKTMIHRLPLTSASKHTPLRDITSQTHIIPIDT